MRLTATPIGELSPPDTVAPATTKLWSGCEPSSAPRPMV
jgi:hypothetical protein